jgi:CubicO group peptidase (beta-lactamase class C family)
MFLNDGIYDGRRILSPSSVREMTRNQIPGVVAQYGIEMFPEAGWGLGWAIQENKKNIRYGSLLSPSAFWHSGAGGVNLWVDPVYEIVGVYFSVELESRPDGGHKWNLDLFANAVTASIIA